MRKQQPSERFLLIHRAFTFFDEWLFYGVLILLYFEGVLESSPALFWGVLFFGASLILISYVKQWRMEAMRFEPSEKEE